MNISLLEPLGITEEEVCAYAKELEAKGHKFTYYDTKTTDPEELARRSAGQDIVMIANNKYPAEVVEKADALKMIAVAFTGIDHVATDVCKEKGIMICNCAGYSNTSVSELAVGMAIGLYRKLSECEAAVRGGGTSAGLTGREIGGKVVGIVGCGKIGTQAARLFKAFGAKVLAYSRHPQESWAAEGIEYADLDTLLSTSDIVSVHLPLNANTRGFLSADKIALMKESAILINCARGPIIDNAALAKALAEKKIAGAAIDVFDMEPPIPSDYPLLGAPNVLLTPHVAFLTKEAMKRRAAIEFANVHAYLDGKPENVCAL